MIEAAGASILAVHGRTRDQKDTRLHRADWAAIAAVRAALRIPVLANGDVRNLEEAAACMEATGAVGVLSATPLLENPALFAPSPAEGRPMTWPATLALEYCDLAEAYGAVPRMVRGHVHKLLGGWLSEFTDLRDMLNQGAHSLAVARQVCAAAQERLREVEAKDGVRTPVPAKGERQLAREAAEAARAEAIAEAAREAAALEALRATDGCAGGACDAPPAEAEAARKRPRQDDDAVAADGMPEAPQQPQHAAAACVA